jgi:hypothetical protein
MKLKQIFSQRFPEGFQIPKHLGFAFHDFSTMNSTYVLIPFHHVARLFHFMNFMWSRYSFYRPLYIRDMERIKYAEIQSLKLELEIIEKNKLIEKLIRISTHPSNDITNTKKSV